MKPKNFHFFFFFTYHSKLVNSIPAVIKNGLITIVRQETPWIGFVWCLAHRLELVLKDGLKEWRNPISTCLQNLYYFYEKSSKKIRELREFQITLGTRCINHKLSCA